MRKPDYYELFKIIKKTNHCSSFSPTGHIDPVEMSTCDKVQGNTVWLKSRIVHIIFLTRQTARKKQTITQLLQRYKHELIFMD